MSRSVPVEFDIGLIQISGEVSSCEFTNIVLENLYLGSSSVISLDVDASFSKLEHSSFTMSNFTLINSIKYSLDQSTQTPIILIHNRG
jgi:hypothetical protein